MPSVLVEVGFLSNAKEERELNDKLQQTYIASGIFRAVRDYKEEIESRK
jgi:N-acetylmuramoyl-L-alanine amidase